jgi:hypothetical protein
MHATAAEIEDAQAVTEDGWSGFYAVKIPVDPMPAKSRCGWRFPDAIWSASPLAGRHG